MISFLAEFVPYISLIVAAIGSMFLVAHSTNVRRQAPVLYPARVRSRDVRRVRQ